MAEENKYLEGNYDGNLGQRSIQMAADAVKAINMPEKVRETQQRAEEIFGEEIFEKTGITNEVFVDRMKETYEEDTFHEYLVDGAKLTCTQATLEPFELPGAGILFQPETIEFEQGDKSQERLYEWLTIPGHLMDINGHTYATINDTKKGTNIYPFRCNCQLPADRNEEKEKIAEHLEACRKNGVCQYLMQLNEQWDNMIRTDGKSYMKKTVTDAEGNTIEAEGITRTSVLFCKHGGLIVPVTSGQDEFGTDNLLISDEDLEKAGISKEALRALMEIEILNEYSRDKGYLVIEDGKLVGIKPHLAGDGFVTVGFGDCLKDNDLAFYTDAKRINRISGFLSDKTDEYYLMKDTVIPVDICFEKLIHDITPLYEKVKSDFEAEGITLSPNQLDALSIIKYQCYTIGDKAYNAVLNNADRETLYDAVLEKHGKKGNFEFRTNIEMNIYYGNNSDESYEVEGGLSGIIVVPLEEYEE